MLDQESLNVSSSSASHNEDLSVESHASVEEPILRIDAKDKLLIRWGSVIAQRAGSHLKEFRAEECVCILLFVNRGRLDVQVADRQVTVGPGHALITLPGEPCFSRPHAEDLQCQWICFEHRRTDSPSESGKINVPRTCAVCDRETFREVFRLLILEYQRYQLNRDEPGPLDSPGAEHLLRSLLSRLNSVQHKPLPCSDALTLLVERARSFMRTHAQESCSIAEIADHLECSKEYLRIAFRHAFGMSPKQYMIDLQMRRAVYLLLYTRLTIGEISSDLGYESPSYFARVFARKYGTSPTEYRLAYGKDYLTGGI